MIGYRNFLKRKLPVLLNTEVKLSFFGKNLRISGIESIAYELTYFQGNILIIGTVTVRILSKKEKSIIIFHDDEAEEFLLNDNISIYHVKAKKSPKGLLYDGPFGSFLPIDEEIL